ncbi:MAG: translation initiation factor IF-2 N-terminal domain-containing protein, partial [Clostridia bacterium]|nr:translation initiation factor IF-2 N-terminal domain-containing protein [Clostridia bacterium]
MMMKYRVHEVAKDLNIPSKDIIDLLGRFYDEPRKHMTALTEEELNLIFEHYSTENAVESFDAYFATVKPKPAAPEITVPPAIEEKMPEPVQSAAPVVQQTPAQEEQAAAPRPVAAAPQPATTAAPQQQ